jgi:hypothetical protein
VPEWWGDSCLPTYSGSWGPYEEGAHPPAPLSADVLGQAGKPFGCAVVHLENFNRASQDTMVIVTAARGRLGFRLGESASHHSDLQSLILES